MTEPFSLAVHHNGADLDLRAQLLLKGFTHQFKVLIGDTEVYFEPDEEGHYRAVKMPWQNEKELASIDRSLLHTVQQKIEEILG
jgi:hypothetical protein